MMHSVRNYFMQKYLTYFKSTYFPQSNRHLCVKQWLKAHKDLLLKTFFNLITTQNKPHSGNTAFVQSVEQIVYIQSPQ